MDNDWALARAEELIPADFRMISGCKDEQTSFGGRAGGACTTALLRVLYADHHAPNDDLSFLDVMLSMRNILGQGQFTQIPELSASRPLDIATKFNIVPDDFSGTLRALLIGINYVGQQVELSGCHNDVLNMKQYIMHVHGCQEGQILVLMDDGKHQYPTRNNILNAFQRIVSYSQPGDAFFLHYSGHGGKLRDDDGDEIDGYDETLVPVDYAVAGQIRDDDIFTTLVLPMPRGVTVTSVMDCGHAGSVLDLPFVFIADGQHERMLIPPEFDFAQLVALFDTWLSNKENQEELAAAIDACCAIL